MHRGLRFLAACVAVGMLTLLDVGAASAAPVDSPDPCAACHARESQEWANSAHARAGGSETFLKLMEQGPKTAVAWEKRECLRCHSPLRYQNPSGPDGVPCQVCHSIDSVDAMGNGSFRLASDGIARGPGGKSAPHPTAASPLFQDSVFCAACHEQYHPVTGVLLQGTYSEWRNSLASSQGLSCQGCHMRDVGSVSHAFGPGAQNPEAKTAALAEALSMTVSAPGSLRAGGYAMVEAALRNSGAGHSLPTGKNEGGEMWLEFWAGADGRILHQEQLPYGVAYQDADGEYKAPLSLWDAAGIFNDHRLLPGKPTTERFAFAVPVDTRGNVTIRATLMYRPRPAWLTERLSLPEDDAYPVLTAESSIQVLEPLPSPVYVAPTPEPTRVPTPTGAVGIGGSTAKMEDRSWMGPFLVAGGCALILVAVWAVARRKV